VHAVLPRSDSLERVHPVPAQLQAWRALGSTQRHAVACGMAGCKLSMRCFCMHGRAVKDNAEEACTLACSGVPRNASAAAGTAAARGQDTYDACYAKCVLQETREVAEERQAVRPLFPAIQTTQDTASESTSCWIGCPAVHIFARGLHAMHVIHAERLSMPRD
jgi:hypothetical protein